MLKKYAGLLIGAAFLAQAHAADDYPSRPISIVVPYTAGGGTDTLARAVANHMQKDLGQTIVVENKPGASTMIAAKSLATSKPDGYTILLTTQGTFSLTPYTQPTKTVDPVQDFEYIATLAKTATVITTSADKGFKSFEEVIAKARTAPEAVSYSTSALGGATHLAVIQLQRELGVEMLAVPFKGVDGQAAVAGGQVDFGLDGESAAVGLINSGKVRPIAVLQAERSPSLPDVPSLRDLGYPNLPGADILLIAAVPKGVPAEIVAKLEAAFKRAIDTPDVAERMHTMRNEPHFLNGADTEALMDEMRNSYEEAARSINLEFNR